MFEKTIIDTSIGTGFNCSTSHKRIETGPINRSVVTLSRRADKNAVNKHKQFISGHVLPFVICECICKIWINMNCELYGA